MAGIVTNPMTQMQALSNQGTAAGAQNSQFDLMSSIIANYLGKAMNPSSLASGSASMAQPLSAGAVENVQNQVGGNIAERGLSESMPQWQSAMANAMASPLMTMQGQGLQNYLTGQKLPFMVPHPAVSMPSVPQTSSALSSGMLGLGAGLALGG